MGSGKWLTVAGLATAESPVCQEQRPTRSQCGDQEAPWWQNKYPEQLPSRKRQHSVLLKHWSLTILPPFLGSSKEGTEAASSKMEEIIRRAGRETETSGK